ncbi:MAG: hypothetical protein EZS28_007762 [Streblomastix strix]|uniref:C2 domain-containing protein n=1 Tax=Streblomastix strix TaxID=222440 RepID=A0A5J4WRL7_9EUKA|nr:MAG: hypothetical protein EZS28_007762 [Streblomastix strix]
MDLLEKSDLCIVFKAGDEEKHTTTAKNTLDYDYTNEEYDLIYNPLMIQNKKDVEVEVYDYDVVTNIDTIGAVKKLPSLNKGTEIDLFLQLKQDDKEEEMKPTKSDQKL